MAMQRETSCRIDPRFTRMFGALPGRSSPQGAKVTGLLVTFHLVP